MTLISIPCVVLLAAAEVLVVVLVGGVIVVVLALEVLTACVAVTLLDTEGEGNPVSHLLPVYPVGHLHE